MSHFIVTSEHPPDAVTSTSKAWMDGTGSNLRRKVHAWLLERALRRAEAQLQALDDRTLHDIGIHRSEIGSVLRDRTGERARNFMMSIAGLP
jgi:uncharacterized protein YjiS (DUF1127 family)